MFPSPLLFSLPPWLLVLHAPSSDLLSSLPVPCLLSRFLPSILLVLVPLPSCHFSLPASHLSLLFFPPLLPSGLPQSPRRKSGLWCWMRSWSSWKTVKTTVRSKPFSCELAPRGYVAPGPGGLGTAALASALLPWGRGEGWEKGGQRHLGGAGGAQAPPPRPVVRGTVSRVTRSGSPHASPGPGHR